MVGKAAVAAVAELVEVRVAIAAAQRRHAPLTQAAAQAEAGAAVLLEVARAAC